jgi:hypothetical protein
LFLSVCARPKISTSNAARTAVGSRASRAGLAAGTFFTRKDAVRFALFEGRHKELIAHYKRAIDALEGVDHLCQADRQ